MLRGFEQIVIVLIISQLMKQTDSCQYFEDRFHFTTQQKPSIVTEKQLSPSIITQQENVGFGVWMLYQPYREMNLVNKREFLEKINVIGDGIQSNEQFLYSLASKNSQQKVLIISQELNQNDQSIVHKVFCNFLNGKRTISFQFDQIGYEGHWILFYFFCNQLEGTTTIGFYQPNFNIPIASQIINDLPQFENTMIHQSGGLQYYINENQQLIILNQFIGVVSCAVSAGNIDYEESILQCSSSMAYEDQCNDEKLQLNKDYLGSDYFIEYSQNYQNPQYYFQGWVRLNQLEGIQLKTQLIRITINFDYNDDRNLGDRELLILYYQNIDAQYNGFEINTYSYSFPQKVRYETPDELKIKVLGAEYQQAIINWHFIRYEIGTKIENYQPLYQVYFPSFDEIKQFRFPISVQHFTKTQFLLLLGGDEYSQSNMKGQTYDLVIHFFCDDPSPELKVTCHYSCFECFGPTKYDCLSCSDDSFRELSLLQNSCNCQSNYIDIENQEICQETDSAFSWIELEEIPLNCEIDGYDQCNENQIQCSYGYFQYQNSCIKCPHYEDLNSKTKKTCLDCLIYPESFRQTLLCTKDALTYNHDQENSYQIIYRNEQELSLYFVEIQENGQISLKICEGCSEYGCKSGYFQRNNKCIKCPQNCQYCQDEFQCQVCITKYRLDFDKTCKKCEDNCYSCGYFLEQQKVFCLLCSNGKYRYDCSCGSFCQDCDDSQYCNYCVDNPKKYYITFDGKNCSHCNIDNCQYCFQYIKVGNNYVATFDTEFRTFQSDYREISLGCALCEENYYFNFNTKKCELKPEDNDCVFAIIEENSLNLKCIIGSIENDATQVSDCLELKFCSQCIKNYFQQLPFCIICMEGYYAGVQSGQCQPCPQECKSCYQQSKIYKDQWKWNIKAFYKYFVNSIGDHSFEDNATSNKQKEMEIICISCKEKYIINNFKCIPKCAETCEKCEVVSGQAICIKCPIYKQVQLKSQDGKGQCIVCPNYCSACVQRSQEEIARINPYFLQSSSNQDSTKICFEKINPNDNTVQYFLDTELFTVNKCQNHSKCKKKITITNTIYCDDLDFVISNNKDPSLRKSVMHARYFFSNEHKEILESQQNQDYLQEIQPSHIIYEFQFKLGEKQFCELNERFSIDVSIMQHVFSVKQVDIKFIGLQQYTRIKFLGKFIISNFTNIIFENLEFDFSQSQSEGIIANESSIQFNNLNFNAFLNITNCVFTTTDWDKNFSVGFLSTHSYSANIQDILIKNLKFTESNLFIFNSFNQKNNGKVKIKNLQIIDSDFSQSSLFVFNATSNNYNNEFYVENINIINCQFKNSNFIQSLLTQNYNIGNSEMKDLTIKNSILSNSSFIHVENIKKLVIYNLQANDLHINQQSDFYDVNVITLIDSKFDKIQMHNNSKLITNNIKLELNLEEQPNALINNLEISNIEYDSIQSIISIKQSKKFEFKNIQLSNNYLLGRLNSKQISFSESIIYIECKVCIFLNINVIRLNGLPEISIMETEDILIENVKLIQNDQFHPQMLHSDFNCLNQLQNFEMSFFIYFGKYQKIVLHNIQILETFTFNSPFLIFQGYDLLEKVQNEFISIFDSKFENNLLLIYYEFSSSSILYFDSNQKSQIKIFNSQFQKNHLNQYYQDQETISATTLIVLQRSGTFIVKNCSFIENILTNSSNSIMYVKTEQVQIENIIFLKNNLIEYSNLNQNLLISITDQKTYFLDDYEKMFPVQSESGNGVFYVNSFKAQNLFINQSYAYSGGGFRLILKGESLVTIQNSQFHNTRTTLDSNIYSKGGCFYIDAQSSSSLTFNFTNIEFHTSYSRTEGGGIYFIPSTIFNQINFKNLTIQNCFAIQNSFLSFQLQKLSQIVSSFVIEGCKFIQEELNFKNFLKNLNDLTTFEAESILLENPLIYSKYGNISIENCSFVNTYSQFLIHIDEAENIIFRELRFINSTNKISPLIRLSLRQQQKGFILIENVEFKKNTQILSHTNIQCQTKQPQQFQSQLQCPISLFSSKKQKQLNYKDNKKYLENQFWCNMQLLINYTDSQYSLMEVMNVENIHFIQIQGLRFENNECKGCYYGLLKILKSDTEMKKLLKINNLEVVNNVCGQSGCLTFLGKSSNSPFRTDLIQNRLLSYQDMKKFTQNIRYDILIENSKFLNNTAQFGGAMMIVEAQSLILDCEFKFNQAKIGGAIYFFSISQMLILIESKITNNAAQIAGGIFLNNQSLQELHSLSVELSENNSTQYSSDVLESPRSLSLTINQNQIPLGKKAVEQSQSKIIERIVLGPQQALGYKNETSFLILPSGRPIGSYFYFDSQTQSLTPYNLTFRVIPLNKFNKQIKGLDGHSCQIQSVIINSSSNEIINDKFNALSYESNKYNKETQDFNFDDLIIYFNPNYEETLFLRLSIECDFIQIPIYDKNPPFLIIDYIKNYQLQVDIKTFHCQLGEYLNTTSGGCVLCDSFQNQYQVSWSAQNCSYKDDIKMKSIESSMIELRPHFWRAYYYSSTIEHCYHLIENCQGGWIPGDNSCMLGHIGALCEQCDLYNSRGDGSFSVSSTYSCGSCDKIAVNALSIILISFWTLISIMMSVSSTVQMIEEFIIGLKLKQFRIVLGIQNASTAILIKILTNYLQIISTISTFQLQIPVGLQTAFNSVGNPIQQMAYSLDCFLITISEIDIIYFRIIWSLIMGIFYILIFILLGMLSKKVNQIKFSISHVSTALLYIFIFMQPSLIQGLISLLSYRVISDEYWIQGNVAYRFDTFHHLQWSIGFSLPLLILIGFIIPFSFWYGLFKNRNNIDKIIVRRIWGYLYNEYKQQSYYWETIKIVQKEFIIIVLVYYDDYIPVKASLVFLILFAYSYSTQQSKPYSTGELNHLDSQSTIVCAVSIILGSSIFSAQQNNLYEIVWPFYFIIAVLNLIFISKLILKICFAYFKKLSETIDKVKKLIINKFSPFLRLHPSLYKLFELNSVKQARIKQRYQKIREVLMPIIQKWLIYKRNNFKRVDVFDDRNKEIKMNSCDELQILSISDPKCSGAMIEHLDSNKIPQNLVQQKIYPVNFSISNELNQQY